MKCSYDPLYQSASPTGYPFPISKYPLLKDLLLAKRVTAAGDVLGPEPGQMRFGGAPASPWAGRYCRRVWRSIMGARGIWAAACIMPSPTMAKDSACSTTSRSLPRNCASRA